MTEVSDTSYDSYIEGLAAVKKKSSTKARTSRGRPKRST